MTKYPSLKLGYEVVEHGGLAGAAFNAAKEKALDSFIGHKLSFLGMADVVRATMDELTSRNKLDAQVELAAVTEIDFMARSIAEKHVKSF